MIKIIKPIPFKKEYKSSEFLKSRVQQGTDFSAVLLSMTSQIDLLCSSIEEKNQLYFVAVVE